MADVTNKVILQIDFQGSNAIQQSASLTKSLNELQKERKAILDKQKEGNDLTQKEVVQLELLNAQLREGQKEQRTIRKFIDDSVNARKAEAGSLQANREKLKELTAEYIRLGKPTKERTKEIKDLSDVVKKQESAIGNDTRKVGSYAQALAGVGGPIGGAINGVKGFNAALLANPILLIIPLIAKLIEGLQKIEPVAEFIEASFAGLSAAVSSVIGGFSKLLQGDFKGFFAGVATDVANAASSAFQLARATQDLEDAQRNSELAIAKNLTQIDKLLLQSKNRTTSEKDRIKLLDEASKIEEENLRKQLTLSSKALEIEYKKVAQAARLGTLTDEQRQKLVDLQVKDEELQRASISLQEKIENRRDQLRQAAEEKQQKAQENEIKRQNELTKKEEERIKEKERQLKAFEDLSKKELDNTLKQVDIETKALQSKEKERFANGEISEKEYQENILKIKVDGLNQQVSDLEDYAKTVEGVDTSIAEKSIEITNLQTDAKLEANKKQLESSKQLAKEEEQLTQLRLDLALTFVNGLQGILNQDAENRKKFSVAIKALAIGEIGINLAKELSSIANYSAGQPLNVLTAGLFGTTLAAIQSSIAIARAGFAVQQVSAQKLEQGGEVKAVNISGKSHSQGGEDVVVGGKRVANIEGGENMYILKKTASSYVNKLSNINQAFGGASFAAPRSYLADGGFVQRSLSSNVNQQLASDQLTNVIRNMPTPVVRVTDINRVQSSNEASVRVSSL